MLVTLMLKNFSLGAEGTTGGGGGGGKGAECVVALTVSVLSQLFSEQIFKDNPPVILLLC